MSTGVYVLGMHRSGTSATTRLIHLLGVPINVESDWLEPAPDNPKGYWESAALVDFNDEIFATLGGDCEHPPDLPPGWQNSRLLESFYARARQLFPTLFPTDQWVWKDPRTCLTFPFWRQAIGASPVVVLPFRNPLEVARSYTKRNDISAEHGLALWERYVTHSLRAARGLPTLVADYDEMMRDPHAWCEEALDFLSEHGVATAPVPNLSEEIDAFIDRSLRHSAHTLEDVRVHPEGARLTELLSYLDEAQGPHPSFAPPALFCAESAQTTSFLARLPERAELRVVEPHRVSVVVPVFDRGEFLSETLESIAAQHYEPLEVIVVENNADARAPLRAQELSGRCALVVEGSGSRAAIRNTGVTVSRGEYVMMLEPGDLLQPGYIERCVDLLQRRATVSIVYGDQQNFGEDSTFQRRSAYDLYELTRTNQIGAAAMFRRRAWDVTCGFAPLEDYEVWDFWLECGQCGHFGTHLADAVVSHRVHPGTEKTDRGRDQRLKARIVLAHPRLYTTGELEWAEGVLRGDPAALECEDAIGVIPGQGGVAPRWSGWRIPELRAQAVLVLADELVHEPRLTKPLRKIESGADVTIVLAGAADETGQLVRGLEATLSSSGLAGPDGPDLLATRLPSCLLAQQADAILTFRTPPLPFSGLPTLDPETLVAWRTVAPAAV